MCMDMGLWVVGVGAHVRKGKMCLGAYGRVEVGCPEGWGCSLEDGGAYVREEGGYVWVSIRGCVYGRMEVLM